MTKSFQVFRRALGALGFVGGITAAIYLFMSAGDESHPPAEERAPWSNWSHTTKPEPPKAPPGPGAQLRSLSVDRSISNEEAAMEIASLLPKLSPSDQEAAAAQLISINFEPASSVWIPSLVDGKLSSHASDILFSALFQLRDEIMLPAMASIADSKNHRLRNQAIEALNGLVEPPEDQSSWAKQVGVALTPNSTR